jgi:hypothetical protein
MVARYQLALVPRPRLPEEELVAVPTPAEPEPLPPLRHHGIELLCVSVSIVFMIHAAVLLLG